MLPVYICDDNEKLLDKLENYVRTYLRLSYENIDPSVQCFSNPEDFIFAIEGISSTGIYFLDIDLNHELNGLDLASKIRQKDPLGFIIFVSTYEKYIPETYTMKLSAIDYIIKDKGDLEKQINSALKTVFTRYEQITEKPELSRPPLVLNLKYSTEVFEQHHIIYAQTVKHKHNIIIYHGNSKTKLPYTLSQFYELLDKELFVMCGRSEIVNILHVQKVDIVKKELILKNGIHLVVSRRQVTNISNALNALYGRNN